MATYFIADLHFGHRNCLAYDNRPCNTIEENDEMIITNWNRQVSDMDDVWILGDISWYGPMKTIDILQQLNGTKHLVIGNHDHKLIRNKDFKAEFAEITNYKELQIYDRKIILSHYPILFWNGQHQGNILLYGHVHNTPEENIFQHTLKTYEETSDKWFHAYNVGCMIKDMQYTPRTLEEIEGFIR